MITSRNKILSLILFPILGCVLVFWSMDHSSNSPASSEDGIVVREDLIQRTTIAGTVVPFRKTIITAPYNGYVKRMYVKVGDTVKQGDPIVTVVQSLQSSDNVFPVRSPFDGIVVQVEKSEGEFIKEGERIDYSHSENAENKARIEMGIEIIKQVVAKKANKSIDEIENEDILQHAPTLILSGTTE